MFNPDLIMRDSITTNPSNAAIAQTHGSSNWLWAVFAVLLLTDLLLIAFNFKRSKTGNTNRQTANVGNNGLNQNGAHSGNRLLHQFAIIILSTAALAYFSMASNLGSTPITPEFHGVRGPTRAIWYVRYIMWFICAPLLLLMVYTGTGRRLRSSFTALFMACFAVVCGLLGALVRTSYKWGYFVMGVLAMLYVIGHMWTARSFPSPTGRSQGAYRGAIGALSLIAIMYPIAWGLCEGGNRIGIVGEMIWYGILDLIIFSAFVPYFLHSHRNVVLGGHHNSNMGGNGYSNMGGNAGYTKSGMAEPTAHAGPGMTASTVHGAGGVGQHNNGLGNNGVGNAGVV